MDNLLVNSQLVIMFIALSTSKLRHIQNMMTNGQAKRENMAWYMTVGITQRMCKLYF